MARNKGIEYIMNKYSEGDGYIAFLDADDLWCPDVVSDEFIARILVKTKIDVILFEGVSSNSECTAFSHPLLYKEHICDGGSGVIWPMIGHFSANLYSVELIKKYNIRFIDGLKYSEDKIFKMQCMFLSDQVYYCSEVLHVYRENENSVMRRIFNYSPIEYYIPIIDAWIMSDHFLNDFETISGKHIDAGYTLASIYFEI